MVLDDPLDIFEHIRVPVNAGKLTKLRFKRVALWQNTLLLYALQKGYDNLLIWEDDQVFYFNARIWCQSFMMPRLHPETMKYFLPRRRKGAKEQRCFIKKSFLRAFASSWLISWQFPMLRATPGDDENKPPPQAFICPEGSSTCNLSPSPATYFHSRQINYPDKNLTTFDGLTGTLEFETLDDQGLIKTSWMEYISKAFPKINDKNAKNIVLHLSKHRDREWTRDELRKALNLEMTESDLEIKLKALVKTDIISQGASNNRYRGVNDDIFDKVFRGVYEEDIRQFDPKVIREEYSTELKRVN